MLEIFIRMLSNVYGELFKDVLDLFGKFDIYCFNL